MTAPLHSVVRWKIGYLRLFFSIALTSDAKLLYHVLIFDFTQLLLIFVSLYKRIHYCHFEVKKA